MKHKSTVLLLALMVATCFNTAKAQQSIKINLHEAIQMALDSNLTVRSSAYSVDVQKALKGASWDIPKTSVEGQYGQFNSYGKDNSFTVSQSFAFPTVYTNQHKLANAGVISSEWQLKASQLDIATRVKQIYWQLAYLRSKQQLIVYKDSLYANFFKAANLRANTGETNRLEMITARSQSMEVKNLLQQITADLNINTQNLQALLNTESAVYPADTLLQRIDFSPTDGNGVLAENPLAGYMQQQIEVSRFEKKVERSRMMPDFSIGYFSQTMKGIQDVNGVPRTFGSGDRLTGVQASVSIPLWFFPHKAKIKAARLKEQVSQLNAESYEKSLSSEYRTLLGEYAKYSTSLVYYEKQAIPEAELIIDQATRSYNGGAMDYIDYVLNIDRAISIKQNYLDALNNYNQTIVRIDFITGKLF